MDKLFCDLETYSPVPIKHGTHAYAEKAEVLLWSYAFNDGPVQCWDVTKRAIPPRELHEYLINPNVLTVWHNGGMFDRIVLKHAMPNLYGRMPIERWYDTMVQALSHSLPGSLDALCEIFNLAPDVSKLKTGRKLIQLFCVPPGKNLKRPRATRRTHPSEWAQFIEYAKADITAMRALHYKMPTVNYSMGSPEMALWYLDQKINNRGFLVDIEMAEAAVRAIDLEQKVLAKRTLEMTNGGVSSATRRDKMLDHMLKEYGIALEDLRKAKVERLIDSGALPPALAELLAVRIQSCSTSTSKYKTLLGSASSDGRLRGTLQYCAASRTRRWGGRLFQPQNLPRPKLKPDAINMGIAALKADCADLVSGNIMELTSSAIRGAIVAPPGKKLVVADLSNIEGRVLAWLAGEEWKLQAFRDFDRGAGHDLYKLAYAKAFNVPPEEATGNKRQIGKVMELALGFAGGVGAFITFALGYGIDLEEMAGIAYDTLPKDLRDESMKFYNWLVEKKGSTHGLSKKAFIVCDTFKRAWRRAHSNVEVFWCAVEAAFYNATITQGVKFYVRGLTFERKGAWLYVRLPSNNYLTYPSPRVHENGGLSYMGRNQFTREWERIKTFGGKLTENFTQAVAGEVLKSSMPIVEHYNYEIVLTVHDEIITEAPDLPTWNAAALASYMARAPLWALDLPLAAAGFDAYRYGKPD